MKTTLFHAVNTTRLFESFADKQLSMKTAFKINRLLNVSSTHYAFYREKIEELYKEHGVFDSQDQPVIGADGQQVKSESQEIFMQLVKELNSVEVEYNENIKFDIDEFNDMKITLAEMQLLEPFISE